MANGRRATSVLTEDAGGVELAIHLGGRLVEVRRFPAPPAMEDVDRDEQLGAWRDWIDAEARRLETEHEADAGRATAPPG